MKYLLTLMASGLIAMSCSSPNEKYEDRRSDAKTEYQEELKEAQEDYKEGEVDDKKERAGDMIDDSEDVNVDIDAGKIETDQ